MTFRERVKARQQLATAKKNRKLAEQGLIAAPMIRSRAITLVHAQGVVLACQAICDGKPYEAQAICQQLNVVMAAVQTQLASEQHDAQAAGRHQAVVAAAPFN